MDWHRKSSLVPSLLECSHFLWTEVVFAVLCNIWVWTSKMIQSLQCFQSSVLDLIGEIADLRMELQGVMRTSYGKATQCTGSPWIDEPKNWIIGIYLRSYDCWTLSSKLEQWILHNQHSWKQQGNQSEERHDPCKTTGPFCGATSTMGALLNGWHLGFESERAMNQHETQQKSLDWREAFVLASVVELLRTSAWLGSAFRLIVLHVVLSTLDQELQPTGKPAMFLFDFSSLSSDWHRDVSRYSHSIHQVMHVKSPDKKPAF